MVMNDHMASTTLDRSDSATQMPSVTRDHATPVRKLIIVVHRCSGAHPLGAQEASAGIRQRRTWAPVDTGRSARAASGSAKLGRVCLS